MKSWEKRQKNLRRNIMESELVGVKNAVKEIDIDDMLHEFDKKDPDKRRRAAVFYVDWETSQMHFKHSGSHCSSKL